MNQCLPIIRSSYLLLIFSLPLLVLTQTNGDPQEGIPNNIWRQANQRWALLQFHTRIEMKDGRVYQGQIHSVAETSLRLWNDSSLFIPGKEDQLLTLEAEDIRLVVIRRERSFWRSAVTAGLIVGVPVGLGTMIGVDPDLLPPIPMGLAAGLAAGGPPGLVWGLIRRSGKVNERFNLDGQPNNGMDLLPQLKAYAIFPYQLPEQQAIRTDHPLSFSSELQQFERALPHSPLMKKIFPIRRFHLEGWAGITHMASTDRITNLFEQAGIPATILNPSPSFSLGGEALMNIYPHWRTGIVFQISDGISVNTDWKVHEGKGYGGSYVCRDPILIAWLGEYVSKPMHPLLIHRTEWSVGAGPSLFLMQRFGTIGYRSQYQLMSSMNERFSDELKLTGLLIQGKWRVYPHKHVSVGVKGQLLLIPPVNIEAVIFDDPSIGPPIGFEAHTLHLSSATLSAGLGLHF